METPESILTSLQKGVWMTSIDFMDAYFYIPIIQEVPVLSRPRSFLSILFFH